MTVYSEVQLRTLQKQQQKHKKISVVIPVFNEEKNIPLVYSHLRNLARTLPQTFEIIFVDDGSRDSSIHHIKSMAVFDDDVGFIEFSRNFGKESATTAGIHHAHGDAVILIDADLQHPVGLIPEFIKRWQDGADIVVGVRNKSKSEGVLKKAGSHLFYWLMNKISDTKIMPGETDFRLLDRKVVDEYCRLTERNRITRGLVNWLGFQRSYIYFDANERQNGVSGFSLIKLFRLAFASFISHSLMPLRLAGYLGGVIIVGAGILGSVMFIDRYIAPLGFAFSGPAILADIILFLVGVVLAAIGILAVYIGTIHQESQNRPLYVVRNKNRSL